MAQPIHCNLCEQEIAELLVTNLTNGDTLGVGASCMLTWLRGTADALDPPKVAKGKATATAEPSADSEEGAAAQPRRPRTPSPRPTVVPDRANDSRAAELAGDATAD